MQKTPAEYVEWTIDFILRPGINSHERGKELFYCVSDAPTPEHAWRAFNAGWSMCDAVPKNGAQAFLDVLTESRPYGISYLSERDKAFFDALPDVVTIYRGTSPLRKKGLAWTTGFEVAKEFAEGHRGIAVPNGTVFQAQIKKSDILTVITDRQESEVVVDPRKLEIKEFIHA